MERCRINEKCFWTIQEIHSLTAINYCNKFDILDRQLILLGDAKKAREKLGWSPRF